MAATTATVFSTEDQQALRRIVENEWTRAMLERDFERTIALCADDIVYMPSGLPALRGKPALLGWLDSPQRIVAFRQPVELIEGHDDLATTCAFFTIAIETGAGQMERRGKVLSSFRKNASGQWLVKAVCWNWDQEMPAG